MKNVSPKCLLISHFCSFLLDFATLMRSLVNITWTWSYSVAFGNPLPQITWTLDSLPLNEAWHVRVGDFVTDVYTVNSYVNISSAKVEDGGLYSCQARNSAGFINKSARVNVLGPPVIRSMANVTALSGQSLYLLCPYAGHPIQGIHWIKGITCSLFSLVVWIFRLFLDRQWRGESTWLQFHAMFSSLFFYSVLLPLSCAFFPHVRVLMFLVSSFLSFSTYFRDDDDGDGDTDGRRLPQNHRQKVFSNGSLIISDVQRSSDWGRYECVVFNEEGHSARKDLFVNVMGKGIEWKDTYFYTLKKFLLLLAVCHFSFTCDPIFPLPMSLMERHARCPLKHVLSLP